MNKELKGYLIIAGIAVAAIAVVFRVLPASVRKVIVGA